ncbi:unnamed protein product [Hyaloperonospora brassicae]|uniref:HTH CENPB-type domain-containing protein n=1 Tax=Hyaloperonospora brassicae TaxID=162125 RepID=A0AAV0UX73_HYABA|nr:unnamed protein product [Hyaloperonospora brassicae]CAI5740888.1 unnamed protein product [Hyaloperonospora brassicae]
MRAVARTAGIETQLKKGFLHVEQLQQLSHRYSEQTCLVWVQRFLASDGEKLDVELRKRREPQPSRLELMMILIVEAERAEKNEFVDKHKDALRG